MPGERVSIDGLARRLDVSPTPVREALARLESDGLVDKRPMAGYTVTPLLTRAGFEELFELRMILEIPAAGRAAQRATPAVVQRLATEAPLPPARFHDRVAEASGNGMLREAFGRLHAHLRLHRMNFPPSHVGVSGDEHDRIVDAIATGDPRRARAAMREHLTAARARHLPYFQE